MSVILKIRNVRLGVFPALFEPSSFEDSDPAYSGVFIFPKDHPQINEINAAIDEVAKEKWRDKAAAVLKTLRATDRTLLHDGDNKAQYDGYADNYYISARNADRPVVLDATGKQLAMGDSGKPYPGCYVDFSVEVWPMDNQYGKRVNAKLRSVKFKADGDAFKGGGTQIDPNELNDDLSDHGSAASDLM